MEDIILVVERSVLAVNTTFPEMNEIAAALADENLLSTYVRPYANFNRRWERALAGLPLFGRAYQRTYGRRRMPSPLAPKHVTEIALAWDTALALYQRSPLRWPSYPRYRKKLTQAMTDAVAQAGALAFRDELLVVASWGCALPVFELAKKAGGIRVLNYPLAHHAFTRTFLTEESALEPTFASTLNSHDRPERQIEQLEQEIDLADHILVGSNFAKETFGQLELPVFAACEDRDECRHRVEGGTDGCLG